MAASKVRVDSHSARSDDDALEGHFCVIVDGEHAGRVGSFEKVSKYGPDGYPESIIFRSRDADDLYLTVPYESVRRAGDYKGGR